MGFLIYLIYLMSQIITDQEMYVWYMEGNILSRECLQNLWKEVKTLLSTNF